MKNAIANTPPSNIAATTFDALDAEVAAQLNVSVIGSIQDRMARAAEHWNAAHLNSVAVGYLLLSAKQESDHGEFGGLIEQYGMNRQRAFEYMSMAKFVTRMPVEARLEIASMPKTKVMARNSLSK